MKRIIITLATAVLLLPGCAKEEERPVKSTIAPETDFYGVVTDNHGQPLEGVVVSDGYTCAATDENGVYQLTGNEFSYQVYLSLPSEYEVPMAEGLPRFWQQIDTGRKRYDFTLTPLAGGKEESFNLYCVADPQCQNDSHVARFEQETVPDIAAMAAASELPCYGITLGDIGYNTGSTDYTNAVFPLMKRAMQADKTGLPLFQLMGNHDNKVIAVSKNNYTVAHDIAAQRNFEYAFGPVNYSFNRGDVHIVAMDDMIFRSHDDYELGFRDDQVEWLRQDLSFVPKERAVIFCCHIPLRNSSSQNVQAVLGLLKEFASVHIMTGHTHYAENSIYDGIYEHVHGAVCGAWWYSTINTDGTPNGYAIYRIEGSSIASWLYKGTGMDAGEQLRVYRADVSYMEGFSSNYQFYYKEAGQIVANVWNADPEWKIEVYENGARTGEMLPFDSSVTRRDAWASGYHCGVLGRNPDNYDRKSTSHLYYYTLKNPAAEVEVRATDRFGNVYTQSHITTASPADYPSYE